MNRMERIKNLLSNKFINFSIEVRDNSHLHVGHNNFDGENETHIQVLLSINSKQKISRLNIHREINDILKNEFDSGMHSLEISII